MSKYAPGIEWVEARDDARQPTMTRIAPPPPRISQPHMHIVLELRIRGVDDAGPLSCTFINAASEDI